MSDESTTPINKVLLADLDPSTAKTKEEQEQIKAQIEKWCQDVVEEVHAVLAKHGVITHTVSFMHSGSGQPFLAAKGDLLTACRLSTRAARTMEARVKQAAGLPLDDHQG